VAKLDGAGVIVNCSTCGRANRLAFEKLTKTARCGHCKAAVSAPSTPIEVEDSAAFDAAASRSALPLVVDFWAPWCGPCRTVAPEIERLARSTAGRYLVVKVNTDAHQDIAGRFRIQSIPTLAVISRGREIDRTSGARPAAEIEAFVDRALEAHHQRAS